MARPNSPPRPGGRPRPGAGKARPTAKRRPTPLATPQAGPAKEAPTSDEVVLSPAPRKPTKKHLKMVPLNGQSEGTYDDPADGSEAFARPSPPAGPPMGGPGPVMMQQPMGIQGPVAGPMMGGPMGPMVGAGMGPMAGAAGQLPYAPLEERATSARVYMVIIGLVMMVCMAILAVAGVVLIAVVQSQVPDEPEPLTQQVVAPPVQRIIPEQQDSGDATADAPSPKPRSRPRSSPKPRSSGTAPRPSPSPAPAPAAAPEAAGTPGTVTVTLTGDLVASSAEVNCNGGAFRERGAFAGGKATVANVPGGSCFLVLVGAGTKKRINFQSARSFTCSGAGSNFTCR